MPSTQSPQIVFFPVDNGDMTLIQLKNGQTILIDVNVRKDADSPDEETPDVIGMLRSMLPEDGQGRLFVDVFLLSHPDKDHCLGVSRHFHLGKPEDCSKDKILIHELWSSPMIFRRALKKQGWTMSDDAKAFRDEAKRRLELFRAGGYRTSYAGNRLKILGEDEGEKTADLLSTAILAKAGDLITTVNERRDHGLQARLLAPQHPSDVLEEEEVLSKNNSSVIIQFSIGYGTNPKAAAFLTGGDAEVVIWEKLWELYGRTDWLEYNLLQTPHHCSWHSLSHDSWKDCPNPQRSEQAFKALSQALPGALIIASCKSIRDDDCDPPCIGAKRIYEEIVFGENGRFLCTGEYPTLSSPKQMKIEITPNGLLEPQTNADSYPLTASVIGRQPLSHG